MDMAALQKALDQMAMERDAAIVAKEDVMGQLRVTKRRLKEAEEEQYKAEEDAASLRAEIQNLQQSDRGHASAFSYMPEHQEIAAVKSELEEMWTRLQQEQLKLATERQRNASLTSKVKELEVAKQNMETALVAARNEQSEQDDVASASITLPLEGASSIDDTGASLDAWNASSLKGEIEKLKTEKTKHEGQLHELASMVERLEKGRQKLLGEIDTQSLEIERLFVENSNLELSLRDSSEMAAQWEIQVQQCLEHNAQLRSEINKLRMEQAALSESAELNHVQRTPGKPGAPDTGHDVLRRDFAKLKRELADAQAVMEEQTAQVAQLTSNLNRAQLTSHSLGRLYKPILSNIENRLIQMKQDLPLNENSLFLAY
ncbi:hypothetical protein MPTK1_4g03720 [Marchantia polymorpha subsp. ruderalis]|uniref:Uncharacterized protein n=2 Tax=Marchantia polymorpha TaxID=3197 RepID=A0AAF6B5Y4_MARPO|nr:hypothetical protein MARPO_0044s0102 [Marchantia polymorpha]PTQ39684.1 hypothetical protein MARPO_0044s0102 [Marchantia polymorpha]BBN07417.1 hypothetical protein Mp_4g03720 [Marchantia polymorpha subsp. ruderalis]BBN07418.1 hypothetical protein Mp_4g03720 [Marchantia polymorpha subsp. ruderalis]|eukprot:PTQ39683.1 hypothetical protein MARPO_0044s0102 [Marchantia polymorpha]